MAREIMCDFCQSELAIGMVSTYGDNAQTMAFGRECRPALLAALAEAWGLFPTETPADDGSDRCAEVIRVVGMDGNPHRLYRCVLPRDHDGDHAREGDGATWTIEHDEEMGDLTVWTSTGEVKPKSRKRKTSADSPEPVES